MGQSDMVYYQTISFPIPVSIGEREGPVLGLPDALQLSRRKAAER